MTSVRLAAAGLLALAAAFAAGTWADRPVERPVRRRAGYEILAGDFHVHSFPFSWSTLSPFDTAIEADRQGLDVIAMTPHNHVWVAKAGRWFARSFEGPLVLVGEEIAWADYHMLAVGITDAIPTGWPASEAIGEIHRQGGVAIAAHPYPVYWPSYDQQAMDALDGAEIVRPESQADERAAADLRSFFSRSDFTAIGSSDYHGTVVPGASRTYVFARQRTEQGVIEALREGRTVVYDRERVYGDPEMIELAASVNLPKDPPILPAPGALRVFSRSAGVIGLLLLLVFNRMGISEGRLKPAPTYNA